MVTGDQVFVPVCVTATAAEKLVVATIEPMVVTAEMVALTAWSPLFMALRS